MEIEDKETIHQSFGLISVSRMSCSPPVNLFDSQTKHGHLIRLSISQARRIHNEETHDSFNMDNEKIVVVNMSESQYAHMVSSINVGAGTPCTITRVGTEMIEDCPQDETAAEYRKEALDGCQDILSRMELVQKLVAQASEKKSAMNKEEKWDLKMACQSAISEITSNLPFLIQSLQERMESIVNSAKTDIETHYMQAIQSAGLNALETKKPVNLIGNDGDQNA